MIRWREPRSCVRAATPVFAWAVPVVLLVAYNWIFLGAITGYDTTNESTGFTWAHFNAKWPIMVQQLYDYGLFFAAPLVVVGGVFIVRASWRVGMRPSRK